MSSDSVKRNSRRCVLVVVLLGSAIGCWFGVNHFVARQIDLIDLTQIGDTDGVRYVLRWAGNQLSRRNRDGKSALHVAPNAEIAQLLIQSGGEVNCVDNLGRTPLITACSSQRLEAVEVLIGKGANVSTAERDGHTALHYAAIVGDADIARALIEAGADVNAKEAQGLTPLHYAADAGSTEVTRVLLSAKADIHLRRLDGETALHAAASSGHQDIAKLLIASGIDVNARKALTGSTALDFASSADMKILLRGSGAKTSAEIDDER